MDEDRFTPAEVALIREAIRELDALWDFDARRDYCDSRGGVTYRTSTAERLREMLGPQAGGELRPLD